MSNLHDVKDDFYDPDWSPPLVAAADALVRGLKVDNPELPYLNEMDTGSRDHYILAAWHVVRAFQKEAAKVR